MKTFFEEQQQELVDSFKKQIKDIAEKTIGDFYTDVSIYAETDAHINFKNMIRDEVLNGIIQEIKSEHSFYSMAHDVRMALLKQHKEELQNKIIEDLQEKLKSVENRYYQMISRSRYLIED